MVVHSSLELQEAVAYLNQLADIVERTGITAADVGQLLLDAFRSSPIEQPSEVRRHVLEMTHCTIDSATFAVGLRRQAQQLCEQAALGDVA